jgi:putative ABC transport system permease protein
MNVMLVSVTERTREIGLRMAIGAATKAIHIQFLGEAVMLSMLGGLFGIFIGMVGSFIFGYVLEWPVSVPVEAVIVAPIFAFAVGIFFGFYPAWRPHVWTRSQLFAMNEEGRDIRLGNVPSDHII